jgi:hypothetical protein
VAAVLVVVVTGDVVVGGVDASFVLPHAASTKGAAISSARRGMMRTVGASD